MHAKNIEIDMNSVMSDSDHYKNTNANRTNIFNRAYSSAQNYLQGFRSSGNSSLPEPY
jgi:hypothetical protein